MSNFAWYSRIKKCQFIFKNSWTHGKIRDCVRQKAWKIVAKIIIFSCKNVEKFDLIDPELNHLHLRRLRFFKRLGRLKRSAALVWCEVQLALLTWLFRLTDIALLKKKRYMRNLRQLSSINKSNVRLSNRHIFLLPRVLKNTSRFIMLFSGL